jgi:hypothetical protein
MNHAIRLNKTSARAQGGEPQQLHNEDRAAVHQERALSEELWCVHIEGLDDFVATQSREVAEREAAAINAYLDGAQEHTPSRMLRASAAVWPYTAAGHARSLETDWEDLQRMPHHQAEQHSHEGRLASVFRQFKALVRSASRKD